MLFVMSIVASLTSPSGPVDVPLMFGRPVAFQNKMECDAVAAQMSDKHNEIKCLPLVIESGKRAEQL